MIDRLRLKTKIALLVVSSAIEMKRDLLEGRQAVGVMDAALPQVNASVVAAQAAADALRSIKDGAQSTLGSIREVAAATHEQSVVSTSIAQKVKEIATMVDQTTAAMRSNAQTAMGLEKIAGELSALVSRFRC